MAKNEKVVRAKVVKISQEETDEQYMQRCYPQSCVNLKKWKKKYNFSGTLEESGISKLLLNLALHDQVKGKTKYNPGKQTLQARVWMEEVKCRKYKGKSEYRPRVNVH